MTKRKKKLDFGSDDRRQLHFYYLFLWTNDHHSRHISRVIGLEEMKKLTKLFLEYEHQSCGDQLVSRQGANFVPQRNVSEKSRVREEKALENSLMQWCDELVTKSQLSLSRERVNIENWTSSRHRVGRFIIHISMWHCAISLASKWNSNKICTIFQSRFAETEFLATRMAQDPRLHFQNIFQLFLAWSNQVSTC